MGRLSLYTKPMKQLQIIIEQDTYDFLRYKSIETGKSSSWLVNEIIKKNIRRV